MPRSVLRPPAARVVASRAMGTLCRLLEGGFTALNAQSPTSSLVAPTAHVGGRGVHKLNGAHGERVDRET